MMKKITFLFMLFAISFGYAQTTSNYCSTEVFHLDIPAETASAINLTIVNTGATTMKVTAANADIDLLEFPGIITGAPILSAPDTSVPGEISITLTWAPAAPVDITFPFIVWSKTTTGGNWQIMNATTPFAGTCAAPTPPEEDASLSALLIDGTNVNGFSPITLDYAVFLPNGTTVVPTVTATTTNGPATTVIMQAPTLPGTATVVVTSEDTSVEQTYTVSFGLEGPNASAPVPSHPQSEVTSVFSQITNDFADPVPTITSHYTDIANTNYNPNWGGGSGNVVIESLAGDVVMKYPNLNYQGIVLGSQTDVDAMEYLHIDFWTDAGTSLRVSVISVTTGEVAYDIDAALGTLPQGQWVGIDVPLSYLTDANPNFDFNIKELKFDEGGIQTFYLDNIYFWKPFVNPSTDATLSDLQVDGSTVNDFSSSTIDYSVVLPKGTTVVPTITATTTNGPATTVITPAAGLPGSTTVVVTSEDASTQKTYTVSFTVDTNSECAGFSDANDSIDPGLTFTDGYNYTAETISGTTDVKITFELLDNRTGIVAYLFRRTPGFQEVPMTKDPVNDNLFSATIPVAETSVTYACKFAFAGGFSITKDFVYTVGENCGTLGLKDFDKVSFKAYPNPTQSSWTVKNVNSVIESIKVYNVLGKSVLSLSPNASEVNVDGSNLKSGLYFAQVKTATGISSLKLIKK